MMEKLAAVKQAADHELTKQKHSYEERLRDLEGTLVGVAMSNVANVQRGTAGGCGIEQ